MSGGVQTGESGAEEHDIGGNDLKALAAEQIKIVLAAMSLPKAQVRVNCTRAQCTVGVGWQNSLPGWPGGSAVLDSGNVC